MAGGVSESQAQVVAPQVGTVLGEMSRGSQQDSLPSGIFNFFLHTHLHTHTHSLTYIRTHLHSHTHTQIHRQIHTQTHTQTRHARTYLVLLLLYITANTDAATHAVSIQYTHLITYAHTHPHHAHTHPHPH